MMKEQTYPISEIFISPQGEGQYTGCLMTFIRLSGCSVGKPFPKELYIEKKCNGKSCDPDIGHSADCNLLKRTLPIYTEMCTLYDGRTFECDTDYRVKERLTVKQLLDQIPLNIKHVCLTGGEPFIHNLESLVTAFNERGLQTHIETSGTILFHKAFPSLLKTHPEYPFHKVFDYNKLSSFNVWITVSPKFDVLPDCLENADELKLLVDKDFTPSNLPTLVVNHKLVYLQPINNEHTVDGKNLKLAMEWQKKYPHWRVSVQLHKVLEANIHERVR